MMANGSNGSKFLTIEEWDDFYSKYTAERRNMNRRLSNLENQVDEIREVKEITIRVDERQKALEERMALLQDEINRQNEKLDTSFEKINNLFASVISHLAVLKADRSNK